ncbi:MAG: hypothetical protein IT425_04415 [Pirellulales bacterium]|nr:hypothetical protein [Pirellulales bacterium]
MPRRIRFLRALCLAHVVLFVGAGNVRSQLYPANPSFSSTEDQNIRAFDLGSARQGASGKMVQVRLANLAAASGTTSAMSLANVATSGDSTSLVFQPGVISGLSAGSSVLRPLLLNTNQHGNLQANYVLSITSDALPSSPAQLLVLAGYARVYAQGDYNEDGSVDAADYILWRKTQGTAPLAGTGADGDFNGLVNATDQAIWRANFGKNLTDGAASGTNHSLVGSEVPEPMAGVMLLLAASVKWLRQRARR